MKNAISLLLVEDDDGDAKAVKRALDKISDKITFTRAHDGIEALEILRSQEDHNESSPCMLLVDINMPRMNGLELLQTIRKDKKLNKTVAFVLTTSNSEEDKAAAYEADVAGYIVKKTAGSDFSALLSQMLGYYSRYCQNEKREIH